MCCFTRVLKVRRYVHHLHWGWLLPLQTGLHLL
jgi:hypothetical protein